MLPLDDPATLAAVVLDEEARRRDSNDDRPPPRADAELPGVGGEELSLRAVVAAGGVSTLAVLFSLNLLDEFDRAAMFVLGPEIQKTFGLSDAGLNTINGVGGILVFLAAVPFGVLADRRHRPTILGVSSLVWAVFALAAGLTRQSWQLVATRVLNGLGKANGPVQSSMLADAYPLEGRSRVFAVHSFANSVGNALGPVLAGAIAAIAGGDEGWRWAFVVLALPSVVLAVIAFGLRDPQRGKHEQQAMLGLTFDERDELPVVLSAAFARIRKIKTMHHLLVGVGALGFVLVGAPGIFNLFLEDRYGLDAFQRGLVGTIVAVGSGIGFPIGGRFGDRLFRESPAKVMLLVGASVAAFGVAYPIALFMPNLPAMVIALTISSAAVSAALVPASSLVASVVPFRLRGVGFSMFGIYLFLVGGFFGGILGGAMSDSLGERPALAILVPISCVIGGAIIARGSRFVRDDMAMIVDETHEELSERQRQADPDAATPVLQVRNLDFSYGPVQVLFDVSIDVWPGEVLALLGTNGAGKSTLLRAISGLGQPDRGVIRIDGRTMTFTDARTRVDLGIVQVPGGKAVFAGLSVRENLLLGAHTFTWDRQRIERKTAEVLELFPKLAERLDQPAGTLSGGEQQMLALGKALLLEPRLLLIDELSLGLAPVVVQELIGIVEGLKGSVTMVIVEQSVNVALSIADRAVFMEKGAVRFEGPAAELLERDDLVRAVFLGQEREG